MNGLEQALGLCNIEGPKHRMQVCSRDDILLDQKRDVIVVFFRLDNFFCQLKARIFVTGQATSPPKYEDSCGSVAASNSWALVWNRKRH